MIDTLVPPRLLARPCRRCGHAGEAHTHYTASTHCAVCGNCRHFRPARWWHRQIDRIRRQTGV
jgi:ribosomal protein L37E